MTKFLDVTGAAHEQQIPLELRLAIIPVIEKYSSGHPHILQLLGSHIIENERKYPDGILGIYDLATALYRVCYKDRGELYDQKLEAIRIAGLSEQFLSLLIYLRMRKFWEFGKKPPSRVTDQAIEWFIENKLFITLDHYICKLTDELLGLRLIIDLCGGTDGPQGQLKWLTEAEIGHLIEDEENPSGFGDDFDFD